MEHYKLYINGKFVDSTSNKTFESINPTTEEPWAIIAEAQGNKEQAAALSKDTI